MIVRIVVAGRVVVVVPISFVFVRIVIAVRVVVVLIVMGVG